MSETNTSMKTSEFLLEIRSEEIPARFQGRASQDLNRLAEATLKDSGLSWNALRTFVTPRRLALVIDGLPLTQPDRREERKGPRVDAPEKAIEGFCRSMGLSQDRLDQQETPKGTFYIATLEHKGAQTADVLAEMVTSILADFPWPKSMRSGTGQARWVRPIKGLVALFDAQVVPVAHEGLTASAVTKGHRFMGAEFSVENFADYQNKLQQNFVILDWADRRDRIAKGLATVGQNKGLTVAEDPGLLDEVTGLVEWPVVIMGDMETKFLELPAEVIRTTMRSHQKYFTVLDAKGKLAPHFVTVANIEAEDGGQAIARGNARVLAARLNDAAYFWHKDIGKPLALNQDDLRRVTFAGDITLHARTSWIERLAPAIAKSIGADDDKVVRAAQLSKCDLVTGTVGEFPELQGVMGRYIATYQGHDPEVCDALRDQYRPKGDEAATMPKVSAALALADKLTHLAYFFATDQKPTGSKDPFALRRAAIGTLRIILDNDLRLSLNGLIAAGHVAAPQPDQWQEAAYELQGFFLDRLKVFWRDAGFAHDHIDAVLATGDDDLVRLQARLVALGAFLKTDDGENLLAGAKRALNILSAEEDKDEAFTPDPDAGVLTDPADQAFLTALATAEPQVQTALEAEDFAAAMTALAGLRGPVDQFFEAVMVNDPQPDIRLNRLKLLSRLRVLLYRVADFSQLQG